LRPGMRTGLRRSNVHPGRFSATGDHHMGAIRAYEKRPPSHLAQGWFTTSPPLRVPDVSTGGTRRS
jgi:hypothetical protein